MDRSRIKLAVKLLAKAESTDSDHESAALALKSYSLLASTLVSGGRPAPSADRHSHASGRSPAAVCSPAAVRASERTSAARRAEAAAAASRAAAYRRFGGGVARQGRRLDCSL